MTKTIAKIIQKNERNLLGVDSKREVKKNDLIQGIQLFIEENDILPGEKDILIYINSNPQTGKYNYHIYRRQTEIVD